jgi:predicted transcriptional regulator
MAVSIRLNKEEEKILKRLADYFHEDRSTLVKKSLFELYENMVDLEEIKEFESRERRGKVPFFTAEDILTRRKFREKRGNRG